MSVAALFGLLITVAIWGIILYVVWIIIGKLKALAPPPFGVLLEVLFWLIVLAVLFNLLTGYAPMPRFGFIR